MEKTTNRRRCSECSREFTSNPRVGERQVTCGHPQCQRERHAYMCQQWHENNAEARRNHYRDIIAPYRKKHPDYQRIWRWLQRMAEIREKISQIIGQLKHLASAQLSGDNKIQAEEIQTSETMREKMKHELDSSHQLIEAVRVFLSNWAPPALREPS